MGGNRAATRGVKEAQEKGRLAMRMENSPKFHLGKQKGEKKGKGTGKKKKVRGENMEKKKRRSKRKIIRIIRCAR